MFNIDYSRRYLDLNTSAVIYYDVTLSKLFNFSKLPFSLRVGFKFTHLQAGNILVQRSKNKVLAYMTAVL